MLLTLSRLRELVREEVERNMRYNAGLGAKGLSTDARIEPPPGLGPNNSVEDDEEQRAHEQEPTQLVPRVEKRFKR